MPVLRSFSGGGDFIDLRLYGLFLYRLQFFVEVIHIGGFEVGVYGGNFVGGALARELVDRRVGGVYRLFQRGGVVGRYRRDVAYGLNGRGGFDLRLDLGAPEINSSQDEDDDDNDRSGQCARRTFCGGSDRRRRRGRGLRLGGCDVFVFHNV
jgi:hypothetical protein